MNENRYAEIEEVGLNEDSFDFEDLEQKLEIELSSKLSDLKILEENRNMIGNPSSLGESVMNVVWEQFINQIGVVAGEDFIKENRGLTLDLRESKHIQTGDNFKKAVELDGKIGVLLKKVKSGEASVKEKFELKKMQIERKSFIANHNRDINYQKRYEDYQSNFQYDKDGKVITKYDRIDGEEKAVLKSGYREPFDTERGKDPKKVGSASVHMDETVSIGELCRDPEVNAHMDKKDIIAFDISDDNLNPMDGRANESKNDHKAQKWLESERNGKKPADRFDIDEKQIKEKDEHARGVLEKEVEKGRKESEKTGKESIIAEAKLIGDKALRSVFMGLLADLIKTIIQKLIVWLRAGKKNIKSFIESIKEAINTFIKNLKQKLLTAANTLLTTIADAILGPVVKTIKKIWIFLKQGAKSLNDAINYVRNSKDKPFSILMLEVGKIIIAGLTAGGAMLLGEIIEKGLLTIPGFAFEIPLLGSLASLLGIFFGALVAGIIGAIALYFIDKAVAKKQKEINENQQFEKKNEIRQTQKKLIVATAVNVDNIKKQTASDIVERHDKAVSEVSHFVDNIKENESESQNIQTQNKKSLDSINDMLDNM
ncbi:MAG: cation diffusion facilitator family transporter [Parabacteroides distasonis]|nr:cation diffusion facilitator family transporter [Parabacteroides distasonis]